MENVKIYNYNVKTADSMLEPVEFFFIKKFNRKRAPNISVDAPDINFLEMGDNIVHVLYFKDETSCEYYKCYVHKYTPKFKADDKEKEGESFRFKVEERKEYDISGDNRINLKLSKTPHRCIFLLPHSGAEMAEPIKEYIDNAAPKDKESIKNELKKLVDAEECTPIDKVCAKLILAKQNETVKFAHFTLPKRKNVRWLGAIPIFYNIDVALFKGEVNIKKIKSENDADESENSESKNYTVLDLYKTLTIEKGEQIELDSPIIVGNDCETTWQDLLTAAGINGDTFYLRFLPDAFARVYILLGDKEDELKAVAYMYTDVEETKIKVVKISETKTDSDKAVSSGVTPAQGPVDNTNNEKPAGAGTKKGENTELYISAAASAFSHDKYTMEDYVNKVRIMARLYSAFAWFMIVIRKFIELIYDNNIEKLRSQYEQWINYTEEYENLINLKNNGQITEEQEKSLSAIDKLPHKHLRETWLKSENKTLVYDYNNYYVIFGKLKKLKVDRDTKQLIIDLDNAIGTFKNNRDAVSHYSLDELKSDADVNEKINTIIELINKIKEYPKFAYLESYLPHFYKLLSQPVSIKFCPKCGEELPGGEYTFHATNQKGKSQL